MSDFERSLVLDELCRRGDKHHADTGRPFVTVSYAQSLDGSIAGVRGTPISISGPESLTYTHALRACHDAILVGIGTVLSDNPALTTRLIEGPSPCPIVLDSCLRIPPDARVLDCGETSQTIVVATNSHDAGRKRDLEKKGVRVVVLEHDARGWVNLEALISFLGEQGIRRLMVEGGSRVLSSFIQLKCVQHLIVTLSMDLVGGLPALQAMPADGRFKARLVPTHRAWMGRDLVLHGDPVWEDTNPAAGAEEEKSDAR